MPSKSWSTGSADACRMQGQICTSTRCVAWAMCSQTRPPVRSPQKVSASLWLRLIVGLVSVSLLAVGAASAALYVRFKAKNSEFREQTLRNQAALITDYLKKAPAGPIVLPAYVIEEFKANSGRFAVVDRDGKLLAASPRRHRAAYRDQQRRAARLLRSPTRPGAALLRALGQDARSTMRRCGSRSPSTPAISSMTACWRNSSRTSPGYGSPSSLSSSSSI